MRVSTLRHRAREEYLKDRKKIKWIPDDRQTILQSLLIVTITSEKPVREPLAKGSTSREIPGFNREASVFRTKTTVFKIETADFNRETTADFHPTDVSRPKGKISNPGKKSICRASPRICRSPMASTGASFWRRPFRRSFDRRRAGCAKRCSRFSFVASARADFWICAPAAE